MAKAMLALVLLPAAVAAGCGVEDRGPQVEALQGRIQSQATEIAALRDTVNALDKRARVLEEQAAAARAAAAKEAPKPAADGATSKDAPAASGEAVPDSPGDAVATFLDTDRGRQKIRDMIQAEEKRRAEEGDQQRREQFMTYIKDRVAGYWTEQLGLDSTQQEAVVKIASEAMDRMGEIWRGMRDARNDPNFATTAREKTQEIVAQAQEKLQQTLTVEQYNKFQELSPGGGLLFGGRGGMGGPGFGGGGGGGGPGAPGGAPRGR
jgi:hypothetical protein